MSTLATEQQHLAKANHDIAEGEKRIVAQTHLIERLHRSGLETGQADLLLVNLKQTLAGWRTHRTLILQEIARLKQTPAQ